ncbi:uncharacterized protein A4U43_C05F7780 [Asparagus officinalis]|uniref:Uncharacterized protein n=1 Tax=Asparagus officinalis TaxID=4686 RepID=A0A5P1EQ32_ASPOF|nr:uncharacterized protein A4U43_C05F7780 [Asparagus officinalis]
MNIEALQRESEMLNIEALQRESEMLGAGLAAQIICECGEWESEMLGAGLAAQIICECGEWKKLRLKLDIGDLVYLLYFGGCPFMEVNLLMWPS